MATKLTAKGEELLQKLHAGELEKLTFTDMAIGNGIWTNDELAENVATLKNVKLKQAVATKYAERKNDKTFIFLSTTFSNKGVAETFYVYEVGLYALDGETEVLYAYDITAVGTPAQAVVQDQNVPQYIPVSLDVGISNIDNASLTFTADLSVISADQFRGHTDDFENPHKTTKAQVGLGNCDNTGDMAKPISTATQNALNGKQQTGDYATNGALNNGLAGKENVFSTLPISKGGTGGATVAEARKNLGLGEFKDEFITNADGIYLKHSANSLTWGNRDFSDVYGVIWGDAKGLAINSRNIGINTALDPAYVLNVVGDSKFGELTVPRVFFSKDPASYSYIDYFGDNLRFLVSPGGSTGYAIMQLNSQNRSVHFFNMTGGVGINTAPDSAYALKVGGNTNISGSMNISGSIVGNSYEDLNLLKTNGFHSWFDPASGTDKPVNNNPMPYCGGVISFSHVTNISAQIAHGTWQENLMFRRQVNDTWSPWYDVLMVNRDTKRLLQPSIGIGVAGDSAYALKVGGAVNIKGTLDVDYALCLRPNAGSPEGGEMHFIGNPNTDVAEVLMDVTQASFRFIGWRKSDGITSAFEMNIARQDIYTNCSMGIKVAPDSAYALKVAGDTKIAGNLSCDLGFYVSGTAQFAGYTEFVGQVASSRGYCGAVYNGGPLRQAIAGLGHIGFTKNAPLYNGGAYTGLYFEVDGAYYAVNGVRLL